MCPAWRGSTVSYAGVADFPKHSLEYSLKFWILPPQKKNTNAHNNARENANISVNLAISSESKLRLQELPFTCLEFSQIFDNHDKWAQRRTKGQKVSKGCISAVHEGYNF